MKEYIKKVQAVNDLVNEWSFVTFQWGKYDCAQLVGALCDKLEIANPLNDFANYISIQQARKALKSKGFKSYNTAIDSFFKPITQGQLMIGDLVGIKSHENGMDAIGIRCGASEPIIFAFYPQWDLQGNPIEAPSKPSAISLEYLQEQCLLTGNYWKVE